MPAPENKTLTTAQFLYEGLIAFYPDVAIRIFELPKGPYPFHTTWEGWTSIGFADVLFKLTGKYNSEEAAVEIRSWLEGKAEPDIPPELEQKIQEYEKARRGRVQLSEKIHKAEEIRINLQKIKPVTEKPAEIVPDESKPEKERLFVYLSPPEQPPVKLTSTEKKKLNNLSTAARLDPAGFVDQLTNLAVSRAKKVYPELVNNPKAIKITEANIRIVALELLLTKLLNPETLINPQLNETFLLNALADPRSKTVQNISKDKRVQDEIARAAQTFAAISSNDIEIKKTLLVPALGENLTNYLLGSSEETRYEGGAQETASSTYKINIKELLDVYRNFAASPISLQSTQAEPDQVLQTAQQTFETIYKNIPLDKKGVISRFLSSRFFQLGVAPVAGAYVGYKAAPYLTQLIIGKGLPLLTSGFTARLLTATAGSSRLLFSRPLFLPIFNINVLRSTVLTPTGKLVNIFGLLSTRGTGLIIAKAGTGKVVQLAVAISSKGVINQALSQTATKILVAISGFFLAHPVIGAIIGAIAGWIAGTALPKIISWVKEHKEDVVILSGIPVIVGLAINSPFLIGAGGLCFLGALASRAGGVAVASRGFLGVVNSGIYAITHVVLPKIGKVVIITAVATPILIAFILFIINSGAYLIPPSSSLISESLYVGVSKQANPPGPFENSVLDNSIQIDYTVTIIAKKSSLQNIRLEYDCRVIKEGSAPECPEINPALPGPADPGFPVTISPTQSYTFTYSVVYDSDYYDSAVVDTITVTADAPEETGARASGSAAVIFGNPPTACFVFEGDWPADKQAIEMSAVVGLSQATYYVTQLCSQGEIYLSYNPIQDNGWGGWFRGNNRIMIYPIGVMTNKIALYTLAHESGHVFGSISGIYSQYVDTPGLEAEYPLCTRGSMSGSENFAEMIALYVIKDPAGASRDAACMGSQTFREKYPNHWQFARDNIFLEDLGW